MRVYQRGKRWCVDFSYNGKRYRKAAGRTKREALLKLGTIERRIEEAERGGQPVSAPRSFAQFAEEYLKYSRVHKRHSTYLRDKTSINLLLKAFKDFKLSQITTRDVEKFQSERALKVKPDTVNRDMETFKHMMGKALDWRYIRINPTHRVKNLKCLLFRNRYLTPYELEALLAECSHNPMLWSIVFTAKETGMRKGELMKLQWKHVNFQRRIITLLETKTNKSRVIPISNSLLPKLERLYIERRGSHVFAKPDGRPYGNWRKAEGFRECCQTSRYRGFQIQRSASHLCVLFSDGRCGYSNRSGTTGPFGHQDDHALRASLQTTPFGCSE